MPLGTDCHILGEVPTCGVKFITVRAMHPDRGMEKVLYSLKMFMFYNQFKLAVREANGLRDVQIFYSDVPQGMANGTTV